LDRGGRGDATRENPDAVLAEVLSGRTHNVGCQPEWAAVGTDRAIGSVQGGMMRSMTLAAVLGGLLVVAACASSPGGGGNAGGPPADAISGGATPVPGSPPPSMQANRAVPDSRAIDLKSAHWSRVEPAGDEVYVYYTATGQPGCHVLGRVDVVETATTVTITLLIGRLPDTDCTGPQPQLAAPYVTVVRLQAPAGTRQVIDGAPR
jgi:hypothetical protein